jgi:hypothetical protein
MRKKTVVTASFTKGSGNTHWNFTLRRRGLSGSAVLHVGTVSVTMGEENRRLSIFWGSRIPVVSTGMGSLW